MTRNTLRFSSLNITTSQQSHLKDIEGKGSMESFVTVRRGCHSHKENTFVLFSCYEVYFKPIGWDQYAFSGGKWMWQRQMAAAACVGIDITVRNVGIYLCVVSQTLLDNDQMDNMGDICVYHCDISLLCLHSCSLTINVFQQKQIAK